MSRYKQNLKFYEFPSDATLSNGIKPIGQNILPFVQYCVAQNRRSTLLAAYLAFEALSASTLTRPVNQPPSSSSSSSSSDAVISH